MAWEGPDPRRKSPDWPPLASENSNRCAQLVRGLDQASFQPLPSTNSGARTAAGTAGSSRAAWRACCSAWLWASDNPGMLTPSTFLTGFCSPQKDGSSLAGSFWRILIQRGNWGSAVGLLSPTRLLSQPPVQLHPRLSAPARGRVFLWAVQGATTGYFFQTREDCFVPFPQASSN